MPSGPQPAVLQQLITMHAFDRMLPDGWQTGRLFAQEQRIRLELVDASGAEHSIELLPIGTEHGREDGQGSLYVYRFVRGADSPRDAQVLLWAAGIVDSALGGMHPRVAAPVESPDERSHASLSGLKGMGNVPATVDSGPTSSPAEPAPPGGDGAPISEPGLTVPRVVALLLGLVESLVVIGAMLLGVVLSGALLLRPDEQIDSEAGSKADEVRPRVQVE
jgi:hypothetical protein